MHVKMKEALYAYKVDASLVKACLTGCCGETLRALLVLSFIEASRLRPTIRSLCSSFGNRNGIRPELKHRNEYLIDAYLI